MEILFLWVQRFRNIQNEGFSFSPRYQFTWEVDDVEEEFTLTVKPNPGYIDGFFGHNIQNVTGIVGANGAGKSNLIDFLQLVLANGASEYDWVGAFYDHSKQRVVVYHSLFDFEIQNLQISKSETWKVNTIADFQVDVYTLDIESPNMWDQAHVKGVSQLEDCRVLFYSPFLDLRNMPEMSGTSREKIFNISQNKLISEDLYHNAFKPEDDLLARHKMQNVQRQFSFVKANEEFVRHIRLPEKVEVRFYKQHEIDKSDLGNNVKAFYKYFDDQMREATDIPNSIMHQAREKNKVGEFDKGLRIKIKYWFLRNLVNNFILNLEKYTYINDEKSKKVSGRPDFDPERPELAAKQFFSEQELISEKKFDFSAYIDLVSDIIAERADLDYREDNEAVFTVSIDDARTLLATHQDYLNAFSRAATGFMAIDWRAVSSGEKAFMDLFSRIDYGLDQILAKKLRKKALVFVMIDEGDIAFHPKWQKEYLDKILAFFCAKDNYRYQLFLTTHSPYLVSDLPYGNVILLGSDKKSGLAAGKLRTFGANIHELLADSFFMGETLFGDFAYQKIKQVFDWAAGKLDLEPQYVRKLIDLVDEPLLHYKLLQHYYKKTGENQQAGYLRSQIAALELKLRQVERGQNDPD